MRVGELVGEPRLAHPRLAHDGDHLSPARVGLAEDPAQVFDLGVAPDEAREPSEGRGLQARSRHPRPRQLEDLDRVREALHGDGPKGSHLEYPSASRRVSAVSRTVPGGASCSIRAAR